MDDKVKKFCKNYEVSILNDQKRRARYYPPKFFSDPERADIIRKDLVEWETEKVLTVEIPEGRFSALVEMEDRFFAHHQHNYGPIDFFQTLMDKEREEAYLRETNPAVKKAYEQYSLMLNLAGFQRKY